VTRIDVVSSNAIGGVLRDQVPDAERDLVLGAQGDSLHAER
jgi:hypothetical protein